MKYNKMNYEFLISVTLCTHLCGYFFEECWALDKTENEYLADYDYDDYEETKEDNIKPNSLVEGRPKNLNPPYFIHPEIQLYAKEGDDVVIECDVRNIKDNNVIMWYKENMVIANGEYVMGHRVYDLKNNSIHIKGVQNEDAGNYFCEVLPGKIRMHAALNVGGGLIIFCDKREVTNKSLIFRQGERHMCECKTYMTDNAVIKWFIDGQRAEYVVTAVKDGQMYIDNTDSEHGGIYQCLVDDGSEIPPYGMVIIDVLYAPKVSTHRHHVNTDPGGNAELYCDYMANPAAVARWLKRGKVLSDTYKYSINNSMHKNRNRTILTVLDVKADDLDEYICQVENGVGFSEVKVHIIYEPEYPQLEGMQIEGKKVTLQWLVRSTQPLTEAVLDYKMAGTFTWSTVSVIHTRRHADIHGVWKIVHEIELPPGEWHVRMRVKNTSGWSKFSAQHDFTILEPDRLDKEARPEKMIVAAGIGGGKGSNGSCCLIINNNVVVVMLIFIFILHLRMK